MSTTNKIFETQTELNKFIFDKRGLDTNIWNGNLDEREMEKWVLKFSRAASHELTELEEALVDTSIPNQERLRQSAVEVIDVVHFIVSIALLTDTDQDSWFDDVKGDQVFRPKQIRDTVLKVRLSLCNLENEFNWKWWSDVVPVNREKVKSVVSDLISNTVLLCKQLMLSSDDIWNVYEQKMNVNKQRQENGYSRVTKTEDDNMSITLSNTQEEQEVLE